MAFGFDSSIPLSAPQTPQTSLAELVNAANSGQQRQVQAAQLQDMLYKRGREMSLADIVRQTAGNYADPTARAYAQGGFGAEADDREKLAPLLEQMHAAHLRDQASTIKSEAQYKNWASSVSPEGLARYGLDRDTYDPQKLQAFVASGLPVDKRGSFEDEQRVRALRADPNSPLSQFSSDVLKKFGVSIPQGLNTGDVMKEEGLLEKLAAAGARSGGAGAALDPATVIHLRPDVTEALGGEDIVMSMDPRQLGLAVKAYDTKRTGDYKDKALGVRTNAQDARTSALERSVSIREKKLGMDVGTRNVPGIEMDDGQVLTPKDASFGKNLRGNVAKSLNFLKALRDDFNQYGPERLKTLGGVLPTAELSRMEGNRARLLEAALQLQGMNPTIGHQALLEQQLRDPNAFANINRSAYNAQLDELEKALKDTELQWASGHGAKKLNPLKEAAQPSTAGAGGDAAPGAAVAAHPQDSVAVQWARTHLKDADQKTAAKAQAILKANGVQ